MPWQACRWLAELYPAMFDELRQEHDDLEVEACHSTQQAWRVQHRNGLVDIVLCNSWCPIKAATRPLESALHAHKCTVALQFNPQGKHRAICMSKTCEASLHSYWNDNSKTLPPPMQVLTQIIAST